MRQCDVFGESTLYKTHFRVLSSVVRLLSRFSLGLFDIYIRQIQLHIHLITRCKRSGVGETFIFRTKVC